MEPKWDPIWGPVPDPGKWHSLKDLHWKWGNRGPESAHFRGHLGDQKGVHFDVKIQKTKENKWFWHRFMCNIDAYH